MPIIHKKLDTLYRTHELIPQVKITIRGHPSKENRNFPNETDSQTETDSHATIRNSDTLFLRRPSDTRRYPTRY